MNPKDPPTTTPPPNTEIEHDGRVGSVIDTVALAICVWWLDDGTTGVVPLVVWQAAQEMEVVV